MSIRNINLALFAILVIIFSSCSSRIFSNSTYSVEHYFEGQSCFELLNLNNDCNHYEWFSICSTITGDCYGEFYHCGTFDIVKDTLTLKPSSEYNHMFDDVTVKMFPTKYLIKGNRIYQADSSFHCHPFLYLKKIH